MKIKAITISIAFILAVIASCGKNEHKNLGTTNKLTPHSMKCYFFFIPDCPVCKSTFTKAMELQEKYKDMGLVISAVYADPKPEHEQLDKMIEAYGFNLPIIYDTTLAMARQYKITTTPQFILLNAFNQVVYSGMMDNYYYALGKHRNIVSENYLEDAILAVLSNTNPKIASTDPIGCKINYQLIQQSSIQ